MTDLTTDPTKGMDEFNKQAREARAAKRQATLGLYSPREIGELTGLDERTLAVWRHKGVGPRYVKVGSRNVFYRLDDIEEWINSGIVETDDTVDTDDEDEDEDQDDLFENFPPDDEGKVFVVDNNYDEKERD